MLELKLKPTDGNPVLLDFPCKVNNELVLTLTPFVSAEGSGKVLAVADGPIGGHRVVIQVGELASYATNDNPQHGIRVLGLTLNAADSGGTLSVVRSGRVSNLAWAFDMAKPVFLGVNGLLTQQPPTHPAAAFSLIVGFPISSTEIFVSLREPIVLGA